jgi:hypothetical protein
MELISFVGENSGTWGQITGLLNKGEWDKVFLVRNGVGKSFTGKGDTIDVDSSRTLLEMKEEISKKLKGKVSGLEIALSIASGNGKEHMALISSLLSLPVGVRLVVFTKDGIEFVN